MISLFGEGLESAFFPCTLVLLIPGIAVTLASRYYSTLAILGFSIGLLVSAWFLFSGRTNDWPNIVLALLFLAAGLLFLRPLTDRLELTSTAAGALVGVGTGALWQPCTGDAFGELLNDLPSLGASGPIRLAFYLIGILSPLFILGALFYFIPDRIQERLERPLAYAGAATLILVAFVVLIGADDQVISQLFAWSESRV